MLARFILTTLLAFGSWGNVQHLKTWVDDGGAMPSECGDPDQGSSLDDPSVDTDPDRPIMDLASDSDDEADPRDDDADGMCRSQTLELWFPRERATFIEARLASAARDS